ncbi:LysR family transcriptional regulator [Neptunomonas antarctica]|uniref:Transcriptional regulator, LysR family n=1 Tax=Neptunomonas antarctica TaxID=619304 RepID=A0A1N7JA77_9GAMM|nr:LysR family transcriptional regulator [Neptunomonas antarctica]SIS46194.1 transcriptional regulator, LysR family [Neptunomonas antarctica]
MKPLRQFDLNLLIIFEALISECHVSRAAEKVFLSQSAMSHALNRLRQYLNDPLLVRTEHGLQPTPRALAMLPEIRKALELIERTLEPTELFTADTSERTFSIASTDYFESVIFPDLVSHLQTIAPHIRLQIEMISEDASSSKLENRQVDLVVGMDASKKIPAHLIAEHWITEQLVCLAGVANTEVGNNLSIQQYINLPHAVFSDLTGDNSSSIDNWLSTQQLSRQSIVRTVNYMAAARIVAQTSAIITLPSHMANLFSQMLAVRVVTPPEGMPSIEMTTIHHPLFDNDPGLCWLKEQIFLLGSQRSNTPPFLSTPLSDPL